MSRTKRSNRSGTSASKSSSKRLPEATRVLWNDTKVTLALSLFVAAAAVTVYLPAIGHSFVVLDDREYVTANPHIRSLGWSTVQWAFTSYEAANWHPLTWLSHALDYQLFALNPAGHHAVNILIHALNAVLLFLFLKWATRRTGPSLLVAALFAVHPINVESVAWVSERKNVLSTLFFLLVLIAYAWYAQRPHWRRYLLVAVLFAIGLMAKPMLVTLPFVLLLLDYWPLDRVAFRGTDIREPGPSGAQPTSWLRLVLEKLPLLALSATSSWLTMKAQHPVVQTLEEFSVGNRVQNALIACGLYLWKMVWPEDLGLYYHAFAFPVWQWTFASLVLIAITVGVIALQKQRYLMVGWFWFLGTLVPVLGLVQVGGYGMADRYAYIPLMGIFIMVAWSLADWTQTKDVSPAWYAAAAMCVVVALGAVTVHQTGYWASDYALNSHTLALKESAVAHNAVAMSLLNPAAALTSEELKLFPSEAGRVEEARRHFERALEMRESQPGEGSLWDRAGTLNNLANLDRMQNRLDEAQMHNEAALKIYRQLAKQNPEVYLPYLAVTLNNLGAVHRLQNRLDEARTNYEESLDLNRELAQKNPSKYDPNLALILNEYGRLLASQGHMDAAEAQYEEALKISRRLGEESPEVYLPQLAVTLTNFGMLNAVQQHMDEARQNFEEALKIDRQLAEQNVNVYLPNVVMNLSNLGRVEFLEGHFAQSRIHYAEAYNLGEKLVRVNSAYAGELAKIEASLNELQRVSSGQVQPKPSGLSH